MGSKRRRYDRQFKVEAVRLTLLSVSVFKRFSPFGFDTIVQ